MKRTLLRKLLIVVFAAGAVFGFARGFAQLGAHHRDHRGDRERRMVEMCVDAALRVRDHRAGGSATSAERP